ncbi:hypothetical protein JKP11_11340 [Vibrio vulnificus]|uniref:hypothetical protein n=1 Tax=Vibrio TaxID=662 RepID=UPI0002377280|nr:MULTISPECIES: hypothetical protein [Vibrio]EGQ9300959.1 hypothetical protein [Vibrio vulnificus]EGR1224872.1 hypothetical protein [Vibrio parahaemolyticus]EID0690933.1 hypothetical protein [Vibrio vulnificus]EIX4872579.1 hypothetical protein [Vibrio vulnificus]EIX4877477.1 hypothetical protein [Vibrio vulnificus]
MIAIEERLLACEKMLGQILASGDADSLDAAYEERAEYLAKKSTLLTYQQALKEILEDIPKPSRVLSNADLIRSICATGESSMPLIDFIKIVESCPLTKDVGKRGFNNYGNWSFTRIAFTLDGVRYEAKRLSYVGGSQKDPFEVYRL